MLTSHACSISVVWTAFGGLRIVVLTTPYHSLRGSADGATTDLCSCEKFADFFWQIFDYFITLQREVDFLWPTRWSLVKVLFFVTRYLPFVDMSLDLYCEPIQLIIAQSHSRVSSQIKWLPA